MSWLSQILFFQRDALSLYQHIFQPLGNDNDIISQKQLYGLLVRL